MTKKQPWMHLVRGNVNINQSIIPNEGMTDSEFEQHHTLQTSGQPNVGESVSTKWEMIKPHVNP